MQIHRFSTTPTRRELFRVWNAAKSLGEIPRSWSFAQHGSLEQTYLGFALMAS